MERSLTAVLFASLLAASPMTSLAAQGAPAPAPAADDPYLWLEEVEGTRALEWVTQHNSATLAELGKDPIFGAIEQQVLAILNSRDRIVYPTVRGEYAYNYWTDAEHPRGYYRRSPLDKYLAGAPAWETVLDVDQLAREENIPWAFGGMSCLAPGERLCLVGLSRGGSDAHEVREFDLVAKRFVDGGFKLPEAKSSSAWIDENTLLVSTDWGPGSLTGSGYPRTVKLWKRGTPLASATTIFEADTSDMGAWAGAYETATGMQALVSFRPRFFEGKTSLWRGGKLVPIDIQLDADPEFFQDQLVVYVRTPWTVGGRTWPVGAVIAMKLDDFLAGKRDFSEVVTPTATMTISGISVTKSALLVSVLDNVEGKLWKFRRDGRRWVKSEVQAPAQGTVSLADLSSTSDRFFFTYSSFLQPTTLYVHEADGRIREVQRLPAQFDARGMVIEQYRARSADGTQVPYFVVHKGDLARDGTTPTLLYGYGGFEVSLTSSYSATVGKAWLERGGVYVLANIRGGGEFGPAWHRSAQNEHRQRAYDDFAAVAQDLIARKITSAPHLGINGGSNGGLLMGVAMTQRPELYGAVAIDVPLLDMLRYHRLLAGASWMAEYGNPDIAEQRAWIEKYSPYQNIRSGQKYPRPLITTTTRDDRVHPGHARKMAAKMEGMGYPVMYYENVEGGHGSGVTPEQRAKMTAVRFTYLWEQLQQRAATP
jgi:prolyl oligopeptidase